MIHLCCQCSKSAEYIRYAQFMDNIGFCEEHAKAYPNFGEDNSYAYWMKRTISEEPVIMPPSPSVTIVGNGGFGSYLHRSLSQYCQIIDDADIVILAVPFDAYEEVASQYANKHLVNVCSVQGPTNDICLKYSDRVTGIHPLFGPQTSLLPGSTKTSLVTLRTNESHIVLNLFEKLSELVFDNNGDPLDGLTHDAIMTLTHMQVVKIATKYAHVLENSKKISEKCLPSSFKQLRRVLETVNGMSDGTKQSILSNKELYLSKL
jgi:hypothetical protein